MDQASFSIFLVAVAAAASYVFLATRVMKERRTRAAVAAVEADLDPADGPIVRAPVYDPIKVLWAIHGGILVAVALWAIIAMLLEVVPLTPASEGEVSPNPDPMTLAISLLVLVVTMTLAVKCFKRMRELPDLPAREQHHLDAGTP